MQADGDRYYEFALQDSLDFVLQLGTRPSRVARHMAWRQLKPRANRFLYHYLALTEDAIARDRARNPIVRSRLWLSSPRDFNDPFDTKSFTSVEGSTRDKRDKMTRLVKTHEPHLMGSRRRTRVDQLMAKNASNWGSFVSNAVENVSSRVGVICFSEDPRNLLMWSRKVSHRDMFAV